MIATLVAACGLLPVAPRPAVHRHAALLAPGVQLQAAQATQRRCGPCLMNAEAEEAPAPPADYDEAEARGIALYQASAHAPLARARARSAC